MNGLLLIVLGVLVLFLLLSGKVDCFFASLKACYSGDVSATPTGATPTNTVNKTPMPTATPNGQTTATNAKDLIDSVLSNRQIYS